MSLIYPLRNMFHSTIFNSSVVLQFLTASYSLYMEVITRGFFFSRRVIIIIILLYLLKSQLYQVPSIPVTLHQLQQLTSSVSEISSASAASLGGRCSLSSNWSSHSDSSPHSSVGDAEYRNNPSNIMARFVYFNLS